ncbi:MAG: exbB [Moraxellaceae bacterium]|jgi:biopolymer transport protein ExbB|nr:exbB [Moraxellaceae bacterium]
MDSNPYGIAALWAQGDIVIKSVAFLLLLMSVTSWYVIVTRGWQAWRLRRVSRHVGGFWHAHTFDEGFALLHVDGRDNPFTSLALEGKAAAEHHASNREDLHGQLSLAEWLTGSLRGEIDESAERIGAGLPILASVGSTAPFIGLFGTVWGIYHALVSIGMAGSASIDKIAGPVGEALIMTAFGLAVAIPAVLGYNALVRANKGVVSRMHRFARQLHAYFLTGSPVARAAGKSGGQ